MGGETRNAAKGWFTRSAVRKIHAVQTRSYDAGEDGRTTSNWSKSPLSADDVIDRNYAALVARSRDQAGRNDYLKKYLGLCKANVIGAAGIKLQAQAADPDGSLDAAANRALETWWKKFSRASNCDIRGKRGLRQMCGKLVVSAARDGEFFVREIYDRRLPMGYALQTIDPLRCPVDYNDDMPGRSGFVRQGIEFTEEGRPVAYFFTVPGAYGAGFYHHGQRLERVPAEEIIHGYIEELEGQRRGIPWAATSLWRLYQLGLFEKAALTNARMGAQSGGFLNFKDDEGPALTEEELDELSADFELDAEGGVFQVLPPGMEFKEFNSQYPSGEFTPFYQSMLRGVGSGMGVSYVSLANDLEGVNFSSIRQGVLDEREHWMEIQEWFIEEFMDRVYRNALKVALLRGHVSGGGVTLRPARLDKYLSVLWQAKRWPWIDPKKDIEAEVKAIEKGLKAPSESIRQSGRDPEAVWAAIAGDIQGMAKAGIPHEFILAAIGGGVSSGAARPMEVEDDEDENED